MEAVARVHQHTCTHTHRHTKSGSADLCADTILWDLVIKRCAFALSTHTHKNKDANTHAVTHREERLFFKEMQAHSQFLCSMDTIKNFHTHTFCMRFI